MDRSPTRAAALFLAVVAALFLATPVAVAQQHAHASLYAKADGDDVKVAVEIAIDPDWHIYHGPTLADMGPPDAVGNPTVVTMIGDGFTWSAPRFPKPVKEDQVFDKTKTWIFEHTGTPVIWLRGSKSAGADVSKLQAKIDGLTCDAGGCVPYGETVDVSGPGSEKLWKKFPADLVVAAAAPQQAAAKGGDSKPADGNGPAAEVKHVRTRLFARADGDDVKAAVEITIDPGWHIFHGPENKDVGPGDPPIGTPTRVTLLGDGFTWGATRYPAPTRVDDAALKTYAFEHTGTVVLWLRGKAKAGADLAKLTAKIDGQVCDANECIPFSETPPNTGRGDDALFAKFPSDLTVASSRENPGSNLAAPRDEIAAMSLWKFLLAAVVAALFSLVMPCTYPMIPITISYFTKQAEKRHTSTLRLSLLYGAGIIASFVAVGVLFAPFIQAFATNGWTNLVIALLFVVFGLSLLGLFILQPPQFLLGAATAATKQGGFLGVFLMGLTLCVTSFTCTVPFVGSILAAAGSGEWFRVVLGMAVFGFVMAVPFVFLSMLPSKVKALPRSGEWLHSLKVTLGFLEIAAAIKFFSNADLYWRWNVLPRELVLILWAGVLVAAALYVWGAVELREDVEMKGEAARGIGAGKLLAGLAFFLFAFYFAAGALGTHLDSTTEALLPGYSRPFHGVDSSGGSLSGERAASGGAEKVAQFIDDYEAAREKARAEHKALAINFTGFQ